MSLNSAEAEGPPAAPAPAKFPPPPYAKSPASAARMKAFRLDGGLVEAYFVRRSDTLLVTFDNLASVGEYDPPQPWLMGTTDRLGHSVLGILARQKDWYRNPDTPALIAALRDVGLFRKFARVVFTGTSMGGFAALAYAALVPGAAVLAFSPQTSLAREIVPFEHRFPYGRRRWDWTTPDYLDAAACLAPGAEVSVVFDPFVAEDKAHVERLAAAGVTRIPLPHLGHRALGVLKEIGALQGLIGAVAEGRHDPVALARVVRARRGSLQWRRALFAEAERRGHQRLALAAARRLLANDPGDDHSRRMVDRLAMLQDQRSRPAIDEIIHVTKGKPRPPFSGAIAHLGRALVLPERRGDAKLASGVLKADGSYVELSRAWIRARKSTPAPTLQPGEAITDLPGRHLFGGHYRAHFGHFLVETTARLWALDHIGGKLDSILFLPYRGEHAAIVKAMAAQKPILDLLGITVPVQCHSGVLRAEELYVPELGFGWLKMYAGSPAYRQFMCTRLAAAAGAEGGDKLYISRARLPAARGGILGESVIEENLAQAGFEIFHPERHPLEVQIARYKAARTIVALDGSALHLAAYVVPSGTRVAIILRRSSANVADYIRQYQGFKGITPEVIDVISKDWVSGDSTRADFRSVGELDFGALFDRLKALGHLPMDFHPQLPSQEEVLHMLDAAGDRRGGAFRALAKGERHPDEARS